MERAVQVRWHDPFELLYNAAPSMQLSVVTAGADAPEVRAMKWGFIPGWWTQARPPRLTINTRGEDAPATELLNIFMQSRGELFDFPRIEGSEVHLGQTSLLAAQPEFTTGERLKGLIELTESRDLLARVLEGREHLSGLKITIGSENDAEALSDFTLVTAEYHAGGLKGVIGVIGPTRMPYEKVVAIVDYTSRLVTNILRS